MTPKLIQTAECQLSVARARIEKLEKENHELRLALSRLGFQLKTQSAVIKSPLLLRNHPDGNERTSSSHNSSVEQSPSFARPTRASRLRQSPSPTDRASTPTADFILSPVRSDSTTNTSKRVVIHGKGCVYQNGELSEIKRTFGYLLSTKSTINKFGQNELRREESFSGFHPSLANPLEVSEYATLKTVTNECPLSDKPANQMQIIPQTKFDDMIDRKGIELRTRLNDNTWVRDPANNISMDHDEIFDIMSRAEKVAKRCLWRWLRRNHPKKFMWLKYLSDMDLGRDSLESLLFGNARLYDHRHTRSFEVEQLINNLIQLRNSVHHFGGSMWTMRMADSLLHDVQKFAVLFYDEDSATRTRSLRDRLRQGAEAVAGEIEILRLLTALPFPGDYPWQPHHTDLFNRFEAELDFYNPDPKLYSPSIIASYVDWVERGRPSYKPDVEESMANVERLQNGGYGGAIPPVPESQQACVTQQSLPTRWRSASMNGPRILVSCGERAHVQDSTRRASFCIGGSAEDRVFL